MRVSLTLGFDIYQFIIVHDTLLCSTDNIPIYNSNIVYRKLLQIICHSAFTNCTKYLFHFSDVRFP